VEDRVEDQLNDAVAVAVQSLCNCGAIAVQLRCHRCAIAVPSLCNCGAIAVQCASDWGTRSCDLIAGTSPFPGNSHSRGKKLQCDCCAIAVRVLCNCCAIDDEQQRYHKIEPLSLVKATTSTDTRSPSQLL